MISLIANTLRKFVRLYWIIQYKSYRTCYDIHKAFRFNGNGISLYGKGKISLKGNSYIGSYSTIQADVGCNVSVGKGCRISHNVRIYSSSAIADQDFSKNELKNKYGDVIIGDYAWIGANVFINPGVKIGANSIVGANSVVTKDVEENCIVGGVPAKIIRYKHE